MQDRERGFVNAESPFERAIRSSIPIRIPNSLRAPPSCARRPVNFLHWGVSYGPAAAGLPPSSPPLVERSPDDPVGESSAFFFQHLSRSDESPPLTTTQTASFPPSCKRCHGRVLMMSWICELLDTTPAHRLMHYWSRSRQKFWLKARPAATLSALFAGRGLRRRHVLFEVERLAAPVTPVTRAVFFRPSSGRNAVGIAEEKSSTLRRRTHV